MSRKTKQEHQNRAIIGIASAIIFAVVGAIMNFGVHGPFKASKWTWLFAPVLPLLAWGCSSLAQRRGYSSGVSYGLIFLTLLGAAISAPLLSGSTVGIVIATATVIPPFVIMTLNERPGNFRSSREKKT